MKGDDRPSRPGRLEAVEKGNKKKRAQGDSARPACKQAFKEFPSFGGVVLWALGRCLQLPINRVICIGVGRADTRGRTLGIS